MTGRNEILGQLRKLIADNLELQVPEKLSEQDRLYADLNIDSIMVLQLMVYIEEVFDIAVPEEDVDPSIFQTLGALISFIQELQEMKV